jgi:hypothetical protein
MRPRRQPVHRLITLSARPREVPAAVAGARRVPDERPVRSEPMTNRAVRRRTDDPGARGGLDEIADHGLTVDRGDDKPHAVESPPLR